MLIDLSNDDFYPLGLGGKVALPEGLVISCGPDLELSVNTPVLSLQVEIYKSFRPGDIVLAKVVSFIPSRLWSFVKTRNGSRETTQVVMGGKIYNLSFSFTSGM